MNITKSSWGYYDGENIYLLKMTNGKMDVVLSNFGATITRIDLPQKSGSIGNIVLG